MLLLYWKEFVPRIIVIGIHTSLPYNSINATMSVLGQKL